MENQSIKYKKNGKEKQKNKPYVGLKFLYSDEREQIVTCEITKIENKIVTFISENGNIYTEDLKIFK